MIFCSLLMPMFLVNAEAGRCAPRPLHARPRLMPQPNDTVCQIKSKLLHLTSVLIDAGSSETSIQKDPRRFRDKLPLVDSCSIQSCFGPPLSEVILRYINVCKARHIT